MKHNNVFLCGWVQSDPIVIKNDKTNEFVEVKVKIVTLRGLRKFGAKTSNIKYDKPLIYTRNPEMCEKISQWRKGDVVEVKGSLTTKDINKITMCPICHARNSQPGNAVYVSPIYVGVRETGVTEEKDALKALKKVGEISNNVTLIGVVCREPQLYTKKKGRVKITSYQLAVRRKFRIAEDSADNNTDFPWVKSFGDIGKNDALVLRKGSYIFLDGWLQTRDFPRKSQCVACGNEYEWKDWSLEIIPYASEYVRNCRTPEELAEEEKKRIEASYKELYGDEEPPQTGEIEGREEIEAKLDEYNSHSVETADVNSIRKLASYEDLD